MTISVSDDVLHFLYAGETPEMKHKIRKQIFDEEERGITHHEVRCAKHTHYIQNGQIIGGRTT